MKKSGANDSATIKCTFKNKKTTKKVTKSVKVNVQANKAAEEEVKVEALAFTFKAIANDTFEASFNKAVSKDAEIKVVLTDSSADVEAEKIEIAENGLTATFQSKTRFVKGTYKMTVKDGEETAEQSIALENEAASQIVITSKTALTNTNNNASTTYSKTNPCSGSVAYIYYDVLNQYGESVKTATSLSWTTSAGKPDVDQVTGKLTVYNGDCKQPFMYGAEIMLVAVDVKTGLNLQSSIKVGMAQKLDSVDMVGFLDTKKPTSILKELPINFAPERYVLLYQAKDQNGNVMDDINETRDVTFFTDAVTVIDSSKLKPADPAKIYTVDGEDYYGVCVEPGMYADKGGEVVITAISSGTGNKTEKNFTVGAAARLQSLVLSAPAVVADGDQGVVLNYVAKDTNGNDVKNYETIVRSTNTLTINASEGTLVIEEDNKGEAVITWSDEADYTYAFGKNVGNNVMDGQDRLVTLNTIVVGGESNYLMMYVKDARKPFEISKITSDTGVVEGCGLNVYLTAEDTASWERSTIRFKDQYGADLRDNAVWAFFSATRLDDGNTYGIKIETKELGSDTIFSGITDTENSWTYDNQGHRVGTSYHNYCFGWYWTNKTNMQTDSMKYTIVYKEKDNDEALIERDEDGNVTRIDTGLSTASKTKTSTVNLYPFSLVQSAVYIKDIDLQRVDIEANEADKENDRPSLHDNFADFENGMDSIVDKTGDLFVLGKPDVKFAVNYDGRTMDVSKDFYAVEASAIDAISGSAIAADVQAELDKVKVGSDFKISKIADGVLTWNKLYDSNSARGTRKVAEVTVKVLDKKANEAAAPTDKKDVVYLTKTVKVTDAPRAATTIAIEDTYTKPLITINGDEMIIRPTRTEIDLNSYIFTDCATDSITGGHICTDITLKDQYGANIADRSGVVFELTSAVESTTELTHVPDSLKLKNSGTNKAKIEGAEIGDTFTLTVKCGGASKTYKVTVGSDTWAGISNSRGTSFDADSILRKKDKDANYFGLGYNR